jgi:hypothetical protein
MRAILNKILKKRKKLVYKYINNIDQAEKVVKSGKTNFPGKPIVESKDKEVDDIYSHLVTQHQHHQGHNINHNFQDLQNFDVDLSLEMNTLPNNLIQQNHHNISSENSSFGSLIDSMKVVEGGTKRTDMTEGEFLTRGKYKGYLDGMGYSKGLPGQKITPIKSNSEKINDLLTNLYPENTFKFINSGNNNQRDKYSTGAMNSYLNSNNSNNQMSANNIMKKYLSRDEALTTEEKFKLLMKKKKI